MRVADYISNFLVEKGVTTVYLLSGGGMMHLLDGLRCNSKLKIVCHNHEQSAGIAAEANARLTNNIGACFGTSGPGATNLVTSITNSWIDSVPVFYFTGQSKLSQTIENSGVQGLRQFGVFEVNITPIVKTITKYCKFVKRVEDIPQILNEAFLLATSGRPGPVLIDIPVDIQGSILPQIISPQVFSPVLGEAKDQELRYVIDKWKSSKRPLIWFGHGVRVANAQNIARKLSQLTKTPVVTTMLANDLIPFNDDLFIGHPGIRGDRPANFAVQAADFILFIGSSLNTLNIGYETDKFAQKAYKVQIDIDDSNFIRQQITVDQQLKIGVKDVIDSITSFWGEKKENPQWINWIKNVEELKIKYSIFSEKHIDEDGRLNIYNVMRTLNNRLTKPVTLVTDAGSAFYVVGQCFEAKENQRVIVSGGLGAMGWALPASIGAATAIQNQEVYCITGDGSLMTNIHDLGVIKGENLNIKILVLNNSGYLSIKNTQDNYFQGRYAGVNADSGVYIPDFKKLAYAYDLPYYKVSTTKKLTDVLNSVNETPGPVMIDISCNLEQLLIPAVTSKKLDNGTMESKPLDDMFPFIEEAELNQIRESLLC